MTGNRKPFDKALFAENDAVAREVVMEYYRHSGIMLTPNPKRYGIDLLCKIDNVVVRGVECEIKRVWSGPVLKYDTVQLPGRKAKYLSDEYPIEYWIINNELTHALVIPGEAVRQAEPVTVSNKYVRFGEKFYQIPVTLCRYADLRNPARLVEPGVLITNSTLDGGGGEVAEKKGESNE